LFQEQGSNKIKDSKGDTKLVSLQNAKIVPQVKDYYDILSADISKIDNNKFQLTIDLAGDPNQNKKYEVVYLCLIYYALPDALDGHKVDQLYTTIVPNFGSGSNFGNKEEGWYMAIFNNTNNSYVLPLSRISDMPMNKVEVFFDAALVGAPSSFNYIVSTMVRVNSTFLDKPPDYLVDSAPDNYDIFWKQWFS
jgi:hypothetical protein